MDITTGTRLGRYEVRAPLGKGGMSEVYLVQDLQLRRPVALKVLPGEYAKSLDRLRRFEQEAHAASALNHPNIVTIYEVGQFNSTPFIVMELVDGETLRRRLKRVHLSVAAALNVATQVAEALAASHAAGVVHRDIKPENIMLRPDGYVKVLDFGLAKLTEEMMSQRATPEASTMTNLDTGPGTVVGTANYMSPEQLRGLAVDGRTDIWSLGVVLYEMLAGGLPFKGHTTGEVIVSILEREPLPLPVVPAHLQHLITKLLNRNRDERYQTADELLADLRSCYQTLKAEGALADEPVNSAGEARPAADSFASGRSTGRFRGPRSTSDISYRPAGARRFGLKSLALAFVLTAALGLAALQFRAALERRPGSAAFQQMRVARLSLPGDVQEAVISPDGKFIASVVQEAGKQSIWIRDVVSNYDMQIVPPAGEIYSGLTFSPDGGFIYYRRVEQESGTVFRVSKLGGPPRQLISDVNTAVALAPDNSRLAFVRRDLKTNTTSLIISDTDGGGEKTLATLGGPESFALGGFLGSGPAWSPDGKSIVAPTDVRGRGVEPHMNLLGVRVEDGSSERLNKQPWDGIERVAWLADGSGLVMNAADDMSTSSYQVWLVSYPGGAARRLTNDTNFYSTVSLTADSGRLVTVHAALLSSLWVAGEGGSGRATQLPASQSKGVNGLAWAADGGLVYTSNQSGNQDIWVMSADGSKQHQLTVGPHAEVEPALAPDGSYVVFVSQEGGTPHIWRVNLDGTNLRQLTRGTYEHTPQLSPDGRWLYFHGHQSGRDAVMKVAAEGGEPVAVTTKPAIRPAVSPDGKLVACYMREEPQNSPWKIAVVPAGGGPPVKIFEAASAVSLAGKTLRWSPDGRALTYIAEVNGVSNIWSQPIDGGPPRPLTDFKEDQIFSFAWSADGSRLACARGLTVREVVLRTDLR